MSFVTRAYNSFFVDENYTVLTKCSKETRLSDEIDYYKNLPAKVSIYFPRVVGSVQEPEKYRLSLEYYAYSNLGEKMMGTFDPEFWRKAFDYIFAFGEKCKQVIPMYSVKMKTESDCIDMYITKTEREHASLVENFEFFRDLQKYDSLKVNGKILRSFDIVWPVIKDKIQKDYVNPNFSLINLSRKSIPNI
jgi:hypothetical protein